MGSSLGPVLANIILTEFEITIVSNLIQSGVSWYMDDTLVLIRPCDIPFVLPKFNSSDENLKFAVDSFSDGNDMYHKKTRTGQYRRFSSFEPFIRKTLWIDSSFFQVWQTNQNSKVLCLGMVFRFKWEILLVVYNMGYEHSFTTPQKTMYPPYMKITL